MKKSIAGKKTMDQVVAAQPLADLEAKWGGGFMKADMFLKAVYTDLAGK